MTAALLLVANVTPPLPVWQQIVLGLAIVGLLLLVIGLSKDREG